MQARPLDRLAGNPRKGAISASPVAWAACAGRRGADVRPFGGRGGETGTPSGFGRGGIRLPGHEGKKGTRTTSVGVPGGFAP